MLGGVIGKALVSEADNPKRISQGRASATFRAAGRRVTFLPRPRWCNSASWQSTVPEQPYGARYSIRRRAAGMRAKTPLGLDGRNDDKGRDR